MSEEQHEAYRKELEALQHAVQTGVQMEMSLDPISNDTNPKHLRVGVNSALCGVAAVARILIQKGIFTELEYWRSQRDLLREEVKIYEERLSEVIGKPIKLL